MFGCVSDRVGLILIPENQEPDLPPPPFGRRIIYKKDYLLITENRGVKVLDTQFWGINSAEDSVR